jgi:predicted Abi (CAAX) family protease
VVALVFTAAALPVAWFGGLLGEPTGVTSLRLLLVPFLAPALLEEAAFRGVLLPPPKGRGGPPSGGGPTTARRGSPSPRGDIRPSRHRVAWWTASLAVYVAAHPASAALARPDALQVFSSPAFLLDALLLGAASTYLRERTSSLWPAVLLHGSVVVAWLNLGGATLLGTT